MLRLAPIRTVAEFSNSVSTTSILRGARQPDEPGKPTLAYTPPLRLVSLVLIYQRRQEVQRIPAGRGGWPLKDVAEDHARYRSRGAQTSIECIVAIPCANNQRADNQAPEVDEDESKMKVMIRMTNAAAGIAFRGMPDGGNREYPNWMAPLLLGKSLRWGHLFSVLSGSGSHDLIGSIILDYA